MALRSTEIVTIAVMMTLSLQSCKESLDIKKPSGSGAANSSTNLNFARPCFDPDGTAPNPNEPTTPTTPAEPTLLSFDGDIKPLVAEHCGPCHVGADPERADLLDFDTMVAQASKAIEFMKAGTMPQEGEKLADEIIATFETWLEHGSPALTLTQTGDEAQCTEGAEVATQANFEKFGTLLFSPESNECLARGWYWNLISRTCEEARDVRDSCNYTEMLEKFKEVKNIQPTLLAYKQYGARIYQCGYQNDRPILTLVNVTKEGANLTLHHKVMEFKTKQELCVGKEQTAGLCANADLDPNEVSFFASEWRQIETTAE